MCENYFYYILKFFTPYDLLSTLINTYHRFFVIPVLSFNCRKLAYFTQKRASKACILCGAYLHLGWKWSSWSFTPWLKMIIWVTGFLRRTPVGDWRFHNYWGSHLQSQVIDFTSIQEIKCFDCQATYIGKTSRNNHTTKRTQMSY